MECNVQPKTLRIFGKVLPSAENMLRNFSFGRKSSTIVLILFYLFIYLFISIEDRNYTSCGLRMLVIWQELKSFQEKTIGGGTI